MISRHAARGDSPLLHNLAKNVRQLRLDADLSQERMSFNTGFHRTYIGGVERAERNLTIQSLEAFAAKLGVDPIELLKP